MDNSNLFLDSKAVAAILMVSKRTLQAEFNLQMQQNSD